MVELLIENYFQHVSLFARVHVLNPRYVMFAKLKELWFKGMDALSNGGRIYLCRL